MSPHVMQWWPGAKTWWLGARSFSRGQVTWQGKTHGSGDELKILLTYLAQILSNSVQANLKTPFLKLLKMTEVGVLSRWCSSLSSHICSLLVWFSMINQNRNPHFLTVFNFIVTVNPDRAAVTPTITDWFHKRFQHNDCLSLSHCPTATRAVLQCYGSVWCETGTHLAPPREPSTSS